MTMMDLEKKMIPVSEWHRAPIVAYELAEKETAQRVPTGIGHDAVLGWYVLQTSGQGPYLIWSENENSAI